jgi:hypothetical protein
MPTLNEDRLNKGRRSTHQAPDRYRGAIDITDEAPPEPMQHASLVWALILAGSLATWVGVGSALIWWAAL